MLSPKLIDLTWNLKLTIFKMKLAFDKQNRKKGTSCFYSALWSLQSCLPEKRFFEKIFGKCQAFLFLLLPLKYCIFYHKKMIFALFKSKLRSDTPWTLNLYRALHIILTYNNLHIALSQFLLSNVHFYL